MTSQAARNPSCPASLCPPQGVCGALRQLADWLDQRGTCGQGLVLGVGTPFDPDKVKMHGSHVDKRQFQAAWDKWWSGPTLGFWLIGRACMYVLAGR